MSILEQAREIEKKVLRVVADGMELESAMDIRQILSELKNAATDMRLDVRDFELADARAEQIRLGHEAQERLKLLEEGILQASQHGLLGAADVAQLSAAMQTLAERLVG